MIFWTSRVNNFFLYLLLCIFVSSCSGLRNHHISTNDIRKKIWRDFGIDNGDIIAKFDLVGTSTRQNDSKLFNKYYPRIINERKQYAHFVATISRTQGLGLKVRQNAYHKLLMLEHLLMEIGSHHKILKASFLKKLNKDLKSQNQLDPKIDYLQKLANVHNVTKTIPLLVPMYLPAVTSNYGPRYLKIKKKAAWHSGIDLSGPKKSAIYSSADGIVESVLRSKGYGNQVIIRHSASIKTRYAHLSKILVKNGQRIDMGQKIGIQGNTGTSTGQHLHFEIIINNHAVNPKDFIKKSL
ncbi:MAG: M23 family metallopeptidase [Rickettsiaceae bacterium]|nr:M23 family metallopeptidase [Rickettsiaceae bacterium]